MQLDFKNDKLKILANSQKKLTVQFGKRIAEKVMMRLAFLSAAPTLADVPTTPPYSRHKLLGDRKEQFAVEIIGRKHPDRIAFEPIGVTKDELADLRNVKAIKIMEIGDYH